MTTYHGSCHCGRVTFSVTTDLATTLICNCSHCSRKGFILHFVQKDQFKLQSGEDSLTSYQFNKHVIDHLFCSICGTEAFAYGIDTPHLAINVRCLEGVAIEELSPTAYDGKAI